MEIISAASFLKNFAIPVFEFYLLRLELFCSFLSLPVVFLSELRLGWLLTFWFWAKFELKSDESFNLSLFLAYKDSDPWFGFTIITDLLVMLGFNLFFELLCPECSPIIWLSIIQLLWRILLFSYWLFWWELWWVEFYVATFDSALSVFVFVYGIPDCYFLLAGLETFYICSFC